MSDFTDALFNPVINSVVQLESQRNALNAQVATQTSQIASQTAQITSQTAQINTLNAQVATITAQLTSAKRDTKLAQLLIAAMYFMGYTPKIDYVFGGESVSGMDCSGFMQCVFKAAGVSLPRVSADQIAFGKAIPLGQELPGDLLGFHLSDRNGVGRDTHIGMCIGNDLMIHTAHPGEGINIADYKKRYGQAWDHVTRII